MTLDSFVLPREKIIVPLETKKIFAYCATGSEKAIRALVSLLKATPESELLYQILLRSMTFADHLLAW